MEVTRNQSGYASNAKGNTGIALGATGLGTAILSLLGNGSQLLGNLSGNKNNDYLGAILAAQMIDCHKNHAICSDDEYVTRYEAKKDAEIAEKDSKIALLEADKHTESKIADVFERLSTRIRALENQVNSNTCDQAVTNQQFVDNLNFTNKQFENVYKAIADGDAKERCYADSNFVKGKLIIDINSICPPVMPLCEPKSK